jgi:Rrf2 family iron-sulfur cluster assembly transcriptional regulator
MRLTTKGRFAVTAMMDLALHQKKTPVTLGAIGERHHISVSYLEQLFGRLRRHSLVSSVRGPGGGYVLGRAADKITVADVMVAVEESVEATQCEGKKNCHGDAGPCMTHELWNSLNLVIVDFLDGISLQTLVNQYQAQQLQRRAAEQQQQVLAYREAKNAVVSSGQMASHPASSSSSLSSLSLLSHT